MFMTMDLAKMVDRRTVSCLQVSWLCSGSFGVCSVLEGVTTMCVAPRWWAGGAYGASAAVGDPWLPY